MKNLENKRDRIIIKVGSKLLLSNGRANERFLLNLFGQVIALKEAGFEVLLVLSGAVAMGKAHFSVATSNLQAAYGQGKMIAIIEQVTTSLQQEVAWLLISRHDIFDRERNVTLCSTIDELLKEGIIPVLNENDALAAAGSNDFDDNDQLATIIAILTNAQRVLVLSDTDGVYTANPNLDPAAERIKQIANINLAIIDRLSQGKSQNGRGGMAGKLKAARLATSVGITFHIMDGELQGVLTDVLLENKEHGTICLPRAAAKPLMSRERWLVSAHNSGASIQLDVGAVAAVKQRKSLLAVGVVRLFGEFAKGDSVELIDHKKDTVALGVTALSRSELELLLNQSEKPFDKEVIHANSLRVLI